MKRDEDLVEPIGRYDVRAARDRRIILPIVGGWLLLCPFVFGYWRTHGGTTDLICGAVLISLGAFFSRRPSGLPFEPSVVVGAWLVLAPMLVQEDRVPFFMTDFLTGFIVVAVSTRPMDPHYWDKYRASLRDVRGERKDDDDFPEL
jgi:hypothetical protein